MLRTFPFSLSGEAKTWLNELDEGTITSWNELREAFIRRYFYSTKFRRLLNEIHIFHQFDNESLVDAWLRLKEMLRTCYGHGLTKGTIIQTLCRGLDVATKGILGAGGIFLYNTPNEAFKILEDKMFAEDVLLNHVGNEELKSIDGVGTGRITKKNDDGVSKEPNKEWKLDEKEFPHNKKDYHYQWHPTQIPHLNRITQES
ncbi:reverse transcriptase domain-containing protein [Tanacetum coccineum]